MTDGPFKSMTRDPSSLTRHEDDYLWYADTDRCDKCGALLVAGSWPFCNGRTGEHDRD